MKTPRPILSVLSLLALLAFPSLVIAKDECDPRMSKAISLHLDSGDCYLKKKAYGRAAEMFRESVTIETNFFGGWNPAWYQLGLLYKAGLGVLKDDILAYMWFNLAVSGIKPIKELRKKSLTQMNILKKEMSRAEIVEANKMAWICKKTNFKQCGYDLNQLLGRK